MHENRTSFRFIRKNSYFYSFYPNGKDFLFGVSNEKNIIRSSYDEEKYLKRKLQSSLLSYSIYLLLFLFIEPARRPKRKKMPPLSFMSPNSSDRLDNFFIATIQTACSVRTRG